MAHVGARVAGRAGASIVAAVMVLALAAAGGAAIAPRWTPAIAGAALLGAGVLVMVPCELQMAATLASVVRLRPGGGETAVRPAALRFAAGYLAFYVPVALALAAVAVLLGRFGSILTIAGGLCALTLGFAALGRVKPSWLSACRGPLYLLRSGRASFGRPFRAGVAFGRYCATCCGPYIYALVVFAGAASRFWLAGALVLAYAVTMAAPFVVPALLAPDRVRELDARLSSNGPALDRASAVGLIAVGVLIVPAGVVGTLL